VGFKELEEALFCGLPLIALGGVRQENAGQLRTKGFAGIACIKAVFCAANPAEAALSLWSAFRQG
jgi:thiamine monophosphate synthase